MGGLVEERAGLILGALPVGITVVDPKGNMVYFNARAAELADRKPEYLGQDIRNCHQKEENRQEVSRIFQGFQDRTRGPFQYEGVRKGRRVRVNVTPLYEGETYLGCVQTLMALAEEGQGGEPF